MSSLAKPETRHCPRFLLGHWCFRQKKCGLIHDKSTLNAAKKEKQFKKDQADHGSLRVMSDVQQLNDIEAGVVPGKNEVLRGSQYGNMVHREVAQKTPAINKKSQKHIKDVQSSNPGKSQGHSSRKKVSESVNHTKAAISANNFPKITQNAPFSNLNRSLPKLSSEQHVGVPRVEGFRYFTRHELSLTARSPSSTITYTGSAISVNSGSEKYRLKYLFDHGNPQVNQFSRKELERIEVKHYEDPIEQTARFSSLSQELSPYDVVGQESPSHDVTESKPLRKFTLFAELPFEIRLVIWQIAIRFPYNPTVQLQPIYDNAGVIVFRDLICRSMTPIVLRINRESRKEALKHFILTLGNTAYLNKATGTVYFDGNEPGDLAHFVDVVPPQELQTIKNIAVHLSDWIWEETFKEAIWEFSHIEQLVMMFSRSDDNYYLRKEAMKLVRKELKQPSENHSGWKVPGIVLVSSNLVEEFLNNNTFA